MSFSSSLVRLMISSVVMRNTSSSTASYGERREGEGGRGGKWYIRECSRVGTQSIACLSILPYRLILQLRHFSSTRTKRCLGFELYAGTGTRRNYPSPHRRGPKNSWARAICTRMRMPSSPAAHIRVCIDVGKAE